MEAPWIEAATYTVSRPLIHIGLVIAFLCVATSIEFLPGLHVNCSTAHQPKGPCKRTSHQTDMKEWSEHSIYCIRHGCPIILVLGSKVEVTIINDYLLTPAGFYKITSNKVFYPCTYELQCLHHGSFCNLSITSMVLGGS